VLLFFSKPPDEFLEQGRNTPR